MPKQLYSCVDDKVDLDVFSSNDEVSEVDLYQANRLKRAKSLLLHTLLWPIYFDDVIRNLISADG